MYKPGVNVYFVNKTEGGGIQGGTTCGATDDLGYHAVENVATVYDLWATVLHQLGSITKPSSTVLAAETFD